MSLATTPFTLLWAKFASGAWYWKWTPAHQRAGTVILLLAKASGAWHRKVTSRWAPGFGRIVLHSKLQVAQQDAAFAFQAVVCSLCPPASWELSSSTLSWHFCTAARS